MNMQTTGTALALPVGTDLAAIFRSEDGVDPIIAAIEAEVRAHVPDLTTAKGRDAIKSLAFKVARSKTALDDAGKAMNEEARRHINTVDAARRKIRERLDALRDEARRPLDEWEAAEEQRVNLLKSRLAALDAARADHLCPSAQIAAVLAEIEATEIGEDWAEKRGDAAIAKDNALTQLRRNLDIARKREDDAAELERLRAAEAARLEQERLAREAEEAAERLARRVAGARKHIEEAGAGRIGGQPQSYGILIYELQQKIPALIDELGAHAADLHALRQTTLENLLAKQAKERADDEARAEADRKAAAAEAERIAEARAAQAKADAEARHQREIEAAKRREEAAAQAERDRIAAEKLAAEEAQRKREENTRIRNKVRNQIAAALAGLSDKTPGAIADALVAGTIPNVTVRF